MNMKKLLLSFISLTIFLASFVWALPVQAATLSFSAPENISVGEVFSLSVRVNSGDRGFNAAEASILFPSDILEVVSIDTAPSSTIFNFWLNHPTFQNDKGTVLFSGGTTKGIVGADIQILTVHMRAKGSGEALITASDASINASDGSGTNILENISALRVRALDAVVTVPKKSEPAQQSPQETPVQSIDRESAQAQTSIEEKDVCGDFFGRCEIPFPTIDVVTVKPQQQTGVAIFVSGTAPEGADVHLQLRREGVRYKEISAIIGTDRKWEGVFNNIFAHGNYSVDAVAESIDGRASSHTSWVDIHVFPPYTWYIFGTAFRWYFILELLIAAFFITSSTFLGVHFLLFRGRIPLPGAYGIVYVLLAVALVIMTGATYFNWKAESETSQGLWGDTQVRCLNFTNSAIAKYNGADLEIYIDDTKLVIPADTGVSPQCVAQVHTHDDTGRLHFDPHEQGVTLADFFAVAGEKLERSGYKFSAQLNGQEFTDRIKTHTLRNEDSIVLRYTKTPPETPVR